MTKIKLGIAYFCQFSHGIGWPAVAAVSSNSEMTNLLGEEICNAMINSTIGLMLMECVEDLKIVRILN